jgi:hypothetical protein
MKKKRTNVLIKLFHYIRVYVLDHEFRQLIRVWFDPTRFDPIWSFSLIIFQLYP